MNKTKVDLTAKMATSLADLEPVRAGFEMAADTESAELSADIDDDSSDAVLFGLSQLMMIALKERAVTRDQVTAVLMSSPKLADAFIRVGLTEDELNALVRPQ